MLRMIVLALQAAVPNAGGLPEAQCAPCSTAADAVQLASQQDGAPVATRRYVVEVRSVEESAGVVYLNSQQQSRDQLNVTLALTPEAARALRARLANDNLRRALRGQRLVVTGHAQRVRVGMGNAETAERFYYYHTQIAVTDIRQLARLAAS